MCNLKSHVLVAVPVPNLDLLTYSVPPDVPAPVVGARVVVPLGSRVVTGIVIEANTATEGASGAAIKPLRQVLDAEAFVPPDVIALARWTAEYYAAGVGDTIPALLPPMARGARADAHKTTRVAAITAAGLEARSADTITDKQREALDLLAGTPTGIPTPELASRGIGSDTVSRLAKHGYVSLRHDRLNRDPFEVVLQSDSSQAQVRLKSGLSPTGDKQRQLTDEQAAAFDRLRAIADRMEFRVALLHGVTGSGKTEIYLRLAAAVRDARRRVLMLVPEIALTPAVAALFREAFGDRVAIQHSGLSDGERHDQWQRIRRGDVDVVVGTRSAVFAPLEDVGLIVVDEEHDGSYKQEESPRYNGRDVAIVRGQRAGALVVLGSATPSMESYHHAMTGKYERVVLERRVLDRPLAAVAVVDMREEYAAEGPEVILSRPLRAAIQARLDRREQSLILLNRRGFATAVFCRQCAGTLDCPNCSVSLVIHGEGHARRARCHYCNYTARVPAACPLCAGPYLEQSGFGTERVEAEVKKTCPGARVARLDRDAIRRRGALGSLLSRFRAGEIDVLVGTQMIAKGHDFPRVTLVGVVSADVGLGIADFRASERTFQLLTQVAGRAGRGEQPGEAIVQTLYPEHYSIQLACRQDYPAFYERELHFRKAMRYPPLVSLVNTVVRARTFNGAMDDAADVVQQVRDNDGGQLRVLGPAPAPLGKLRGEYRAQLLIKGTNRKRIREALQRALASRPELQRRVVVDVDPLSVL
ncbi:MAG: primosomal protein N' [Acidobacteria bacterium 13_1_40CM_3_65_5]|nr:MAG: primosomal protein N' [Acidobacteria bacterium 13_1_40CM_3_65_5]